MPVLTYEDHQPYISRVLNGEVTALFAPGTKVLMFAMTSGTTGEPKRLPITEELFREYKMGWRMWGAGVYGDHPDLLLKKTLQLTSDWQQFTAPSGMPCGQISGLAATTRPAVSQIDVSAAAGNDANPRRRGQALRDAAIRTGAAQGGHDHHGEPEHAGRIRPPSEPAERIADPRHPRRHAIVRNSGGSRERHSANGSPGAIRDVRASCERLADQHGALLPEAAWPDLSVLAVWTGGSVGIFLPQLAELYGKVAIRDHGLSASEGRMTIPLADGTSAGLLDFYHHYFEFIPVEEHGKSNPIVLEAHELEEGQRLLHPAHHFRRPVSLRHPRCRALRRLRRPGAAAGVPEQGQELLQPHGREAQRVPGDSRRRKNVRRDEFADRISSCSRR